MVLRDVVRIEVQDRKAHDVRQVGGERKAIVDVALLVDQQVDLFRTHEIVEIGDVGGRAHPCGVGQVVLPVVRRAGAAGVREVVYLATPRCEVVGQQFGDPVQSAEIVVDASVRPEADGGCRRLVRPSFGQRIGQKALGRGPEFGQQLVGLVPVDRTRQQFVDRSLARVHPVGEAEALQKGPYAAVHALRGAAERQRYEGTVLQNGEDRSVEGVGYDPACRGYGLQPRLDGQIAVGFRSVEFESVCREEADRLAVLRRMAAYLVEGDLRRPVDQVEESVIAGRGLLFAEYRPQVVGAIEQQRGVADQFGARVTRLAAKRRAFGFAESHRTELLQQRGKARGVGLREYGASEARRIGDFRHGDRCETQEIAVDVR